ncbi:MAG: cytochrome c, partial [Elusimicrobia bacterium]|nr:cytochrome c [Elusimicrobiota bacterium]
LAAGDLVALVEYLSSLRPSLDPHAIHEPSVEAGSRLFKYTGCVACHGPAGSGGHPNNNVPGGVIPALPALAATYTEDELYQRIRRGKRPDKENLRGPEPFVAMPAWGEVLNEQELRSLALYVKSLAGDAPASDW